MSAFLPVSEPWERPAVSLSLGGMTSCKPNCRVTISVVTTETLEARHQGSNALARWATGSLSSATPGLSLAGVLSSAHGLVSVGRGGFTTAHVNTSHRVSALEISQWLAESSRSFTDSGSSRGDYYTIHILRWNFRHHSWFAAVSIL